LLEEKRYIVRSGAVLNSILNMRRGKHSLHFVVDDKLLPHSIVNITYNENIHIGVYYIILYILFIYIIYLYYIFIYLFVCLYVYTYIYIFILFIYIIYSKQFSSYWKITITLLNISLLSLPPPFPNTRCIAYNFDGSNVDEYDFSMLGYEDGEEIPNINDYLK
jgi:hypothetical protein